MKLIFENEPLVIGGRVYGIRMDNGTPQLYEQTDFPDTEGWPKLELERPLVFFDLETTGTSVQDDKICSIAAVKLHPDGTWDAESINQIINPGVPIPEAASDVHGITDAMVQGKPTFAEFANILWEYLADSDLAGYNILQFDVPMVMNHFAALPTPIRFPLPAQKFVDSCVIFKAMEERTLSAAYKHYTGKEMEGAHDAAADVKASIEVLHQQVAIHGHFGALGTSVADLHGMCVTGTGLVDFSRVLRRLPDGTIVFAIGKHRGKDVRTEPGYTAWMLGPKADFNENTKHKLRQALDGKSYNP